MTTITNTNLYSAAYSAIETFLKESVTDPRSRFKGNWVHASMPNVNDAGFDGYPFMVLQIDINEAEKTFDVDTSEKSFRVRIAIYSKDASDIDSMSDEIVGNFKDETKLTDFKARAIDSSPINWDLDMNGQKILFRTIGFILRSRI